MRKIMIATVLTLAAAAGCKSHGHHTTAADNTERNSRGPAAKPTADEAVNNSSDLEITRRIRAAVMRDSSLSTNAHNCKIVVKDGNVTLVGPVANDTERKKIEQIATTVVGTGNVVDNLELTE